MTDNRLRTAGEATSALSTYDPTTPLRTAAQRGYPMHHLAQVAPTPDDAERDGTPPTEPPVVRLGVGQQIDPLPESAADAPGWSR